MLTGAGSPATGGATGTQHTGGGCRAGLLMLFTFGMYSGWCAGPEPPEAAAGSSAATRATVAATKSGARFLT